MTLTRSLHQYHPKDELIHPTHPRTTCVLCAGDISDTKQDRKRHFRSFLPYWVYCPFPRCPWRGDRQDNLKNRKMAHASCDQVLKQEYCKIYESSLLARSAVCGKLETESAAYTVLLEVEMRVQDWQSWHMDRLVEPRAERFWDPEAWRVLRPCVFQPPSSPHPSTTFSPSYHTVMRSF